MGRRENAFGWRTLGIHGLCILGPPSCGCTRSRFLAKIASGRVATSRVGLASALSELWVCEESYGRRLGGEKSPMRCLRPRGVHYVGKEHRRLCFSFCSKADPDVAQTAKVRKVQDLAAFIQWAIRVRSLASSATLAPLELDHCL